MSRRIYSRADARRKASKWLGRLVSVAEMEALGWPSKNYTEEDFESAVRALGGAPDPCVAAFQEDVDRVRQLFPWIAGRDPSGLWMMGLPYLADLLVEPDQPPWRKDGAATPELHGLYMALGIQLHKYLVADWLAMQHGVDPWGAVAAIEGFVEPRDVKCAEGPPKRRLLAEIPQRWSEMAMRYLRAAPALHRKGRQDFLKGVVLAVAGWHVDRHSLRILYRKVGEWEARRRLYEAFRREYARLHPELELRSYDSWQAFQVAVTRARRKLPTL